MLQVLVRFEANTDKLTGGFDEIVLREQTVLRFGVARSEHARNSTAGRGRRHKEYRTVRAFYFGSGGVPGRVPRDTGLADRLWAGTEIIRPWALGNGRRGQGQAGESDHEDLLHRFVFLQRGLVFQLPSSDPTDLSTYPIDAHDARYLSHNLIIPPQRSGLCRFAKGMFANNNNANRVRESPRSGEIDTNRSVVAT